MTMPIPDWTGDIPWDSSRGELNLEISVCLTEPACPTVMLRWETSSKVIYRNDMKTVEDGVAAAIAWAKENITFNSGERSTDGSNT